jgi:hypothetical protein
LAASILVFTLFVWVGLGWFAAPVEYYRAGKRRGMKTETTGFRTTICSIVVLAGAPKQSLLPARACMNGQGCGGRPEPCPPAVKKKNNRTCPDRALTVPPSSVESSRGYSPTAQHVLGDPNWMVDESSYDDPHRGSARADRRYARSLNSPTLIWVKLNNKDYFIFRISAAFAAL